MISVDSDDLGSMLLATVRYSVRGNGYTPEYVAKLLRRHFASVDGYEQRQILTEIEVAIALKKRPQIETEEWSKLVEEIRPPKAPYTVNYRCGKCSAEGVKLWRGVHGCKSKEGFDLLCALCLAPHEVVDDDGKVACMLLGRRTDQVGDWLPAVPVDDTYWGYSSVPTADTRWWKALPTYSATQLESAEEKK